MIASRTVIAVVCFGVSCAFAASSRASDAQTVAVDVAGGVPGYSNARLTSYLIDQMGKQAGRNWRFVDGSADPADKNRVSWSFKVLRVVWPGGSHNGFPSPSYSTARLSAETKLYLGGAYQMTISSHPTTNGGYDDRELETMVRGVAEAMFAQKQDSGKP